MCLADRCSLVVFTESTLAMGSIGPLRDVTGHQLFSRRRQVEAKFEVLWTRLGLLSPMLFISGLSMTPNPRARILPSRSRCFLSLRFGWHLWLYTGVWRFLPWWCQRFLLLVWSLHGLFDCAAPFYMISVICSICQMGRKIGFELQCGESVVVNKRNAGLDLDIAQGWKCLWFLPPAAGRLFWVHS